MTHHTDPTSSLEAVQGVISDPSENTTLTDVLDEYRLGGFDSDFTPREGGLIVCAACGSELPAEGFTMLSRRRLEGASDPDDMMSVVATMCPQCGAKGVIILGVGPTAPAEHADVSVAMQDGRSTSALPGDATPAEDPATLAEQAD